jgi:hypothetical protein
VCLPYRFERIFPVLRRDYLESLRKGLAEEKEQRKRTVAGEDANWRNPLVHLAESGAAERVLQLINGEHATLRGMNRLDRLRMDVHLALNLCLNRDGRWRHSVRDFYVFLKAVVADGVYVGLVRPPDPVRIYVGRTPVGGGWSMDADLAGFLEWCAGLRAHLKTRLEWACASHGYLVSMHSLLGELEGYFKEVSGKIDASGYLRVRAKRNREFAQFGSTVTAEYDRGKWEEMERAVSALEHHELLALFDNYRGLLTPS